MLNFLVSFFVSTMFSFFIEFVTFFFFLKALSHLLSHSFGTYFVGA